MEFAFSDKFKHNLKSLPKRIRKKAYKQLSFLQTDFWYPSLHTEKIKGMTFQGRDVWAIRIDRKHRITFVVKKEENVYYLLEAGKHDIIE